MSKTKIPKADDEEQSRLFIEKAREIGADESSALRSDKLVGHLARKPPQPKKKDKDK